MIKLLPKTFIDKIEFTDSCWIWTAYKNQHGYGQYYNGEKVVYAHRFSWIAFNKLLIPKGMNVLHKCDTPSCVNPDHLILGSQKDNVRDMITKGRQKYLYGEEHVNSKLSKDEVAEIRRLYKPGRPGKPSEFSQKKLANMFGVSKTVICGIINQRSWTSG